MLYTPGNFSLEWRGVPVVEACGHMGLLRIRHLETPQCRVADVVLGRLLSENYSELCRSLLL